MKKKLHQIIMFKSPFARHFLIFEFVSNVQPTLASDTETVMFVYLEVIPQFQSTTVRYIDLIQKFMEFGVVYLDAFNILWN